MTVHLYALAGLASVVVYFLVSKIARFIQIRRIEREHGCKRPPYVKQRETIIGYDTYKSQTQASKDRIILENALKRYKTYGNTWSLAVFGRRFVATIEPENVKTILATNFKDYGLGKRLKAFGPLLGAGIFDTDGAHWEHSRALVRPNFARNQVADLDTFETHIQNMIEKIPRDGSSVDLQKLLFQLTFDSATEFLFGESVGILLSPEGSEQQLFAQAFDYAQIELAKRSRLGPLMFLHRNAKFDEACKRVHNFVDRFVFKALEYRKLEKNYKADESGNGQYVFLNELAKATDDPQRLRDELLNILIAGRDTTAGLLSNTLHALARRPNVWAKISAEVETLNGKRPDYDTLRNMKYLRNVLNEALRLWPSVPGNGRFAVRDTILPCGGGPNGQSPILIRKGQTVTWNVYSMHRRQDIYGPDAEEFKPERWDEKSLARVGWGYLPFNGGPRICVGQQFALTEASYTLVRLCQEFKAIESRDSRPWVEGLALTLSSGNGTIVVMVPR